jgi:Spin-doc zinc-finger
MNTSKISKLSGNLNFKPSWELDYFVIRSGNNVICLICSATLAGFRKSNVSRHYEIYHKREYDYFQNNNRAAQLKLLKAPHIPEDDPCDENLSVQIIKASYVVSYEIAKAKKPFTDGLFVKKLCGQILKCFGEKTAEHRKMVDKICLSAQTVTRRVRDISDQLKYSLYDRIRNCSYYSLALDESTDKTSTAQLLIFIRTIDQSFQINEELLNMISMHGNTTGGQIFRAVEVSVQPIGGFSKLSAICTDGAPAMIGKNQGLHGQLLQRKINLPLYHCIIHQENLCAKKIGFEDTMTTVISIVNLIKGGHHSLTHRKFKVFLNELDAEYGDLVLFTEVRWLSRGNCLNRFFSLQEEITLFLKDYVETTVSTRLLEKMKTTNFRKELAFLTDITGHLNELNYKLQIHKQSIIELVSAIDGFVKKLYLLKIDLQTNALNFFKCCKTLSSQRKNLKFNNFAETVQCL